MLGLNRRDWMLAFMGKVARCTVNRSAPQLEFPMEGYPIHGVYF